MAFLCKKLVFTCASINKNFNWNPAGFFIKHCIEKIFEMCADFFHKIHKFQFLISSLLAIRHEQLHFYYTSIQYSWQADIWKYLRAWNIFIILVSSIHDKMIYGNYLLAWNIFIILVSSIHDKMIYGNYLRAWNIFIILVSSIHDKMIYGKYLRAWNNFKVFTELSSIKQDGPRGIKLCFMEIW